MPFAQIYMLEGRTEEQKKAVIEKVTQALVDAVGAGVGVLDAGDQHARLGEGVEELGDERDRPAHPHVDRLGAVPGLGEGGRARPV